MRYAGDILAEEFLGVAGSHVRCGLSVGLGVVWLWRVVVRYADSTIPICGSGVIQRWSEGVG